MNCISADVGADSSSWFPLGARTDRQTDRQTDRRRCWRGSVCTTERHVTWPTDLCVPAASTDGRRQSRSAVSRALLLVPWTRTSADQRSSAAYDSRTWNRLPTALRSPELSLASFKRQLKTHLSVPALDSSGCSCGCRVPSSCAVVTVQRVRRRLQTSRLDSTRNEIYRLVP